MDSQGAAYAAFSPSVKASIWIEKLTLVQNTYGLTSGEINHIQNLIDYISPELYVDNESLLGAHDWLTDWRSIGTDTFGWDSLKTYLIAETWLPINEINNIRFRAWESQNVAGSSSSDPTMHTPVIGEVALDCDCRYQISCHITLEDCDDDEGCAAIWKCGLIGTSKCDGICTENSGTRDIPIYPGNIDIQPSSHI